MGIVQRQILVTLFFTFPTFAQVALWLRLTCIRLIPCQLKK